MKRKLLSILLAGVIAVSSGSMAVTAEDGALPLTEEEVRAHLAIEEMGDLNGDGNIDPTDALAALRYAVGLDESFPLEATDPAFYADLNGDGVIDPIDALCILRVSVGLDTAEIYSFLEVGAFSSAVISGYEVDAPTLLTDPEGAPEGYDAVFFEEHDLICFATTAEDAAVGQVAYTDAYVYLRYWSGSTEGDTVCVAVAIPKGFADGKKLTVAHITVITAELLFEDEFEGDTLNPWKWERCPQWIRGGGGSQWDNNMSYLSGDGRLILRAEWDETNKLVRAGAVRTNGRFEAGFGYYEASIKFPVAKGIWGAFWMMVGNVNLVDNSSEDGIEIDIFESAFSERNQGNQAMHWDGYGADAKSSAHYQYNANVYDGAFHTFGLWRTEEDYIFYIDGKEVWRDQAGGICPLDGYMKLTVESAAWAGGGTAESIAALPAEMEVDYVRVWDTNPYAK